MFELRFCPGGEACTGSGEKHHIPAYDADGRDVIPAHQYAHDKHDCPHGDEAKGLWLEGGEHLVCRGCGLDYT